MKAPFILGRLIFGGYFIYNGMNHVLQTKQMTDSKNVALPELAVSATGASPSARWDKYSAGDQTSSGAPRPLWDFSSGVPPIMHVAQPSKLERIRKVVRREGCA